MSSVQLDLFDIAWSAVIVLLLGLLLAAYRLGLSRVLALASFRLVLQLLAIGYVLAFLFEPGNEAWMALLAVVMLIVATWEIVARQQRRLASWRPWALGGSALFVSSFAITLYGLLVVVRPDPWYEPQYLIPLLGMVMSNTMSAISLSLERLTTSVWDQRNVIEQRLALGEEAEEASRRYARDAVRSGMMPVINSMMTAGIVSLPGMMTGQILAGADPRQAVKYQIMIWFFIAGGTGFGMSLGLRLMRRRLFDSRDRLRLDRLQGG